MGISKLSKGHNLRWESSRMMLPEHVTELNKSRLNNTKSKKPIIDEQQWNEFSLVFTEAQHLDRKIKITIWDDGFLWIYSDGYIILIYT